MSTSAHPPPLRASVCLQDGSVHSPRPSNRSIDPLGEIYAIGLATGVVLASWSSLPPGFGCFGCYWRPLPVSRLKTERPMGKRARGMIKGRVGALLPARLSTQRIGARALSHLSGSPNATVFSMLLEHNVNTPHCKLRMLIS